MQKQTIIILSIGIIVITGVVILAVIYGGNKNSTGVNTSPEKITARSEFAQCLKKEGATFYGAFWCPHCQDQKDMFKGAVEQLPYQECSKPNRQQNAVCNKANIKSYPTWEFADDSRQTGVLSYTQLSEATGCEIPQEIESKGADEKNMNSAATGTETNSNSNENE